MDRYWTGRRNVNNGVEMNTPTQAEIEDLAKQDLDELYRLLGEAMADEEGLERSPDPETSREQGRGLFERNVEKLKKVICEDWNYCSNATLQVSSSAVVQSVSRVLGPFGWAAGLRISIFMKKGADKLCGCQS